MTVFFKSLPPLNPASFSQDTILSFQETLKANHLAYIAPRLYGSRFSADCPQKLFSSKHDTWGRILLVTSRTEERPQHASCWLKHGRHCFEK